jgi:hypothetical protein
VTIHFHVGHVPFAFHAGKQAEDRERAEKDLALTWYGLNLPCAGWLARYVLRKWAGGGR